VAAFCCNRSNEGQINLDDHNLPALNSLKTLLKLLQKQILEAAKGCRKMKSLKVNIAEITDHQKIINGLLVKLSPYEQRNFTNKHGVEMVN
jgi:hypothetical protein